MADVVHISRWRCARICATCEEGEVCRCAEDQKSRVWLLDGTEGVIQQFLGDGPFYGTWGSGRTGAMTELDACKARVEKAVWHD